MLGFSFSVLSSSFVMNSDVLLGVDASVFSYFSVSSFSPFVNSSGNKILGTGSSGGKVTSVSSSSRKLSKLSPFSVVYDVSGCIVDTSCPSDSRYN